MGSLIQKGWRKLPASAQCEITRLFLSNFTPQTISKLIFRIQLNTDYAIYHILKYYKYRNCNFIFPTIGFSNDDKCCHWRRKWFKRWFVCARSYKIANAQNSLTFYSLPSLLYSSLVRNITIEYRSEGEFLLSIVAVLSFILYPFPFS